MKFGEAMKSAQTDGTNYRKKIRVHSRLVAFAFTGITAGIALIWFSGGLVQTYARYKETGGVAESAVKVPLASSPKSEWKQVSIPPAGRSKKIPVPVGMRPVAKGTNFLLHSVLADNTDCAFGQGCADTGPVAYMYFANTSSEVETYVSYAFERIPGF